MDVLELSHVSKAFGRTPVLKDLSFSVPEHTVYGFIGQNGAGKTTTMKIILGLCRADGGEILVNREKVRYGSGRTCLLYTSPAPQDQAVSPDADSYQGILPPPAESLRPRCWQKQNKSPTGSRGNRPSPVLLQFCYFLYTFRSPENLSSSFSLSAGRHDKTSISYSVRQCCCLVKLFVSGILLRGGNFFVDAETILSYNVSM